jgi:hypothetical protein
MSFEVLTGEKIKATTFWNVTPCSLVNDYRYFEEKHSIIFTGNHFPCTTAWRTQIVDGAGGFHVWGIPENTLRQKMPKAGGFLAWNWPRATSLSAYKTS